MAENIKATEKGLVKISEDVVASIATLAAYEVEGVKGKPSKKAAKRNAKNVRLTYEGQNAVIDISIIVKYGCMIPDVGAEVQENVASAVESMTGLKVDAVNVHCSGIAFTKDKGKSK